MRILPKTDLARVEFFEQHTAAWAASPAAIGLTPAQAATLSAATASARAAYLAQQVAMEAARAATLKFHNLVRTMTDLGADAVKGIKLAAETANDPHIYVLAQIPVPAQPGPTPPLEPPTALVAEPRADGTMSLSWKGSIKYRTFFSIWRRIGSAGTWTNLGATAARSFIDATIPASPVPTRVTYAIRSQRDDEISEPSEFVQVSFGTEVGRGSTLRWAA
jgi:hypothetical protein